MKIKRCRICKSNKLGEVFSLGKQPLANNLLSSPNEKAKNYPLALVQCAHCGLIQLNYIVPKEKLFDNYFYIPSISKTYLAHLDKMSSALIADLNLKKGNLVIDIGGSDGSLLEAFEKKGMMVVNVEPAKNVVSRVLKVNEYLNKKTAKKLVRKFGKAKLVTATNVFAHIHDLDEFVESLDVLLDDDGVFFAQFPDVRNLLKENQFDTIYHEHLSYFTYEPLHHLFMNSPFELYKIDNSTIHGGSMRIYVRRRDNILKKFSDNVISIKKDLTNYLKKEKAKGKKIVAFGAAAKGMVLLYYCGLDSNIIDYVADGTPYKQGKYSPGTLIPVVPESELLKNPPDIVLILAWNYKEEIITKVRKMLAKTKKKVTFVLPIPKFEIVE
jgi:2-polyprenyl-3-methyl-5-hydroxy-6-metoxy-1,4-benzoquinol methylase